MGNICDAKQQTYTIESRDKIRNDLQNQIPNDSTIYQKIVKEVLNDSQAVQGLEEQEQQEFSLAKQMNNNMVHDGPKHFLYEINAYSLSTKLLKKIQTYKSVPHQSQSELQTKQRQRQLTKNNIDSLHNCAKQIDYQIHKLSNHNIPENENNLINIRICKIIMRNNDLLNNIGSKIILTVRLDQIKDSSQKCQFLINNKFQQIIINGRKQHKIVAVCSSDPEQQQQQQIEYSFWQPISQRIHQISFNVLPQQVIKKQQTISHHIDIVRKYSPKIIITNSINEQQSLITNNSQLHNNPQVRFNLSIPCSVNFLTGILPKTHISNIHHLSTNHEGLQVIGILIYKIEHIGSDQNTHRNKVINLLQARNQVIIDTIKQLEKYGLDALDNQMIVTPNPNLELYESFITEFSATGKVTGDKVFERKMSKYIDREIQEDFD